MIKSCSFIILALSTCTIPCLAQQSPICPSNDLAWTTLAPMPSARDRFEAGVVNGIIYCVGGQNRSDNLTDVEAYNTGTNTWSTVAPMPTGREDLGVAVVNGILYAIGGYDGSNMLSTVEAYDPLRNFWSEKAPMSSPRCNLAVGVVNGVIYAVGGNDSSSAAVNTVEAFDPRANSWTLKASMPTARSQLSVGVVNGILYAVGGNTSRCITTPGKLVANLESYNPATNTWTQGLAPEPTALEESLGASMNGLFYVMGGVTTGPVVDTVDAYDPATNRWSEKSSMEAVQEAQGGAVWNNVLFSVGGWGPGFMNDNQAGTFQCLPANPSTEPVIEDPATLFYQHCQRLTETLKNLRDQGIDTRPLFDRIQQARNKFAGRQADDVSDDLNDLDVKTATVQQETDLIKITVDFIHGLPLKDNDNQDALKRISDLRSKLAQLAVNGDGTFETEMTKIKRSIQCGVISIKDLKDTFYKFTDVVYQLQGKVQKFEPEEDRGYRLIIDDGTGLLKVFYSGSLLDVGLNDFVGIRGTYDPTEGVLQAVQVGKILK